MANTESGDGTTTWRDNASVQYRNCIFIGKGDKLVRADGDDGDGSSGYGHNGTLSLADRFTTDAYEADGSPYVDSVNASADAAFMDGLYQAQAAGGKLCEITDCVISGFGDISGDPYASLLPQSMQDTNVETDALPINALVRGPVVVAGGKEREPCRGYRSSSPRTWYQPSHQRPIGRLLLSSELPWWVLPNRELVLGMDRG